MSYLTLPYIDDLIPLVKKAGEAILEIYYKSRQFEVQAKSDATPLTQADLIAHEIIVSGLQQITPHLPVLSEESAPIPYATRQQWHQYWLVDPLDGTREFIRHSSDFVISIALIEDQIATFGLIYSPVLDEIYFAQKHQGAFKKSPALPPVKLHVRPWHDKTIIVVGHYYKIEKLKQVLGNFGQYEILALGSALKFCTIAAGMAHLYPRLGLTSEWDTAAGQIIVEEAGGLVVDFNLQPLRYNTKDSLFNPYFIVVSDQQLLQKFADLGNNFGMPSIG